MINCYHFGMIDPKPREITCFRSTEMVMDTWRRSHHIPDLTIWKHLRVTEKLEVFQI